MLLFSRIIARAAYLFNIGSNRFTIANPVHSIFKWLRQCDVSEAKQMIETNPNLVILDVRTQEEYDEGHLENAVLIPVSELESRLDELDVEDEILVYCRSGVRSATASQTLVDNGFSSVYNMLGARAHDYLSKALKISKQLKKQQFIKRIEKLLSKTE